MHIYGKSLCACFSLLWHNGITCVYRKLYLYFYSLLLWKQTVQHLHPNKLVTKVSFTFFWSTVVYTTVEWIHIQLVCCSVSNLRCLRHNLCILLRINEIKSFGTRDLEPFIKFWSQTEFKYHGVRVYVCGCLCVCVCL